MLSCVLQGNLTKRVYRRYTLYEVCRGELEAIERCQNGASEVFESIVDRYKKQSYSIAFGLVGNHEDAQKQGANAVVQVRFATSMVMQSASEMLAYGTAVVVE